jgi:hypothetical protein
MKLNFMFTFLFYQQVHTEYTILVSGLSGQTKARSLLRPGFTLPLMPMASTFEHNPVA